MNVYDSVNKVWPASIPPITRVEAERAAKRLGKAFNTPWRARRVRRCWIDPTGKRPLTRGWWRLVHDISHYTWDERRLRLPIGGTRPHGGFHAALEREMAEYVVRHGWLDGKLKSKPPKPKAPPDPVAVRADRLAAARATLAAWERKLKLATTKVKRWRRIVGARERARAVAAP